MSKQLPSEVESEIQSEMGFRRLVAGTLLEISELVSELIISLRNKEFDEGLAIAREEDGPSQEVKHG